VLIERSNLINILKLVLREVLDSSVKFGCQLESDHIPLQHFFITIEHIFEHGMKSKKVTFLKFHH
jgi:RUN and FYVE domain-containing protein 1/2